MSDSHIYALDDNGRVTEQQIAIIRPASPEVAQMVLGKPCTDDGRSDFVWVRLQNGDLILGVFPRGDTYFDCEVEAP